MSDWVNQAASEIEERQAANAAERQLIDVSIFWGNFRTQLESDVSQIKQIPEFKSTLSKGVFRVVPLIDGLRIELHTNAAIVVNVEHLGQSLSMHRIVEQWDRLVEDTRVEFTFVRRATGVYLVRGERMLNCEQASQLILEPMVKFLEIEWQN